MRKLDLALERVGSNQNVKYAFVLKSPTPFNHSDGFGVYRTLLAALHGGDVSTFFFLEMTEMRLCLSFDAQSAQNMLYGGRCAKFSLCQPGHMTSSHGPKDMHINPSGSSKLPAVLNVLKKIKESMNLEAAADSLSKDTVKQGKKKFFALDCTLSKTIEK